MKKVDQSTKDSILLHLRKQGPCNATSLSKALKVTPSAIRQQLALLQGEGLIEPERERKGPGRPIHNYHLSEKSEALFDKRYERVALELIDAVVDLDGKEKLKELLLKRRDRILESYQKEIEGLPPEKAFKKVAKLQDDSGYMAVASEEGKLNVLKEHNCPFIDVARKYPEFCESERRMYEELLGTKVELHDCRAQGASVCIFKTELK